MSPIIRPASRADASALAAIYGHHVIHGVGTFEEAPPSAEEMAARMGAVQSRGLPYLVAELDGAVAALAYAGPFRLRAAYRYTVEDSVYVAPGRQGRGLGKAVLGEVLKACEALGLRQVLALIGDSGNAGSVGVHTALGFQPAGVMRGVGFKNGRWLDVVVMQKPLNGGLDGAPTAEGLNLSGV